MLGGGTIARAASDAAGGRLSPVDARTLMQRWTSKAERTRLCALGADLRRVYHKFLADAQRRTAAAAAAAGPRHPRGRRRDGARRSPTTRPDAGVRGVDLSEPMLRKAAEKVPSGAAVAGEAMR